MDDFITLSAPGTDECARNMWIITVVCELPGNLLSPDKCLGRYLLICVDIPIRLPKGKLDCIGKLVREKFLFCHRRLFLQFSESKGHMSGHHSDTMSGQKHMLPIHLWCTKHTETRKLPRRYFASLSHACMYGRKPSATGLKWARAWMATIIVYFFTFTARCGATILSTKWMD